MDVIDNSSSSSNSQVGSVPPSASSFQRQASKTLHTVAEACEAPTSSADGILAAIGKFERCCATMGAREGWEGVKKTIAPLTAAVELGKQTIRRSQGLLVTPRMQDHLREIIAWHAKRCSAALVGSIYEPPPLTKEEKKYKAKVQTVAGMKRKERLFIIKMQPEADPPLPRPPSSTTVATARSPPSPPTPVSAKSAASRLSSGKSSKLCSFSKSTRGVTFFARVARVSPGAVFVPATRPTVRVDPRAGHLSGSGAIGG